jgi:hypothetical protein
MLAVTGTKGGVVSQVSINEKYSNMFNMTVVTINVMLGDTSSTVIKIPIGVRGVSHHLPYDELLYIMARYINQRAQGPINRFIRWTTGEIKGLHNILLRYDDIKSDIEYEKRVGTSNSWMKVLRSRANNRNVSNITNAVSKANNGKLAMNDILPDCTFVIGMSDVDRLEEKTGVNLFKNPMAASKFLNDAMGLGLLIVDEVHSVVHVLYSSYTSYASSPIKAFAAKAVAKGDSAEIMIEFMKRVGA